MSKPGSRQSGNGGMLVSGQAPLAKSSAWVIR
jgi:hypothetical protein